MCHKFPLVLSSIALACAPGEALLDNDSFDSSNTDTFTGPPLSLSVHSDCTVHHEKPPFNRCDGDQLLGTHLSEARDANGDGIWAAGETLTLSMELFDTVDSDDPDEPVYYPGVFLRLPPDVELLSPNPELMHEGAHEITWFYMIPQGERYGFDVELVRDQPLATSTSIEFTVGSLMCQSEEPRRQCPTPSPLYIEVSP